MDLAKKAASGPFFPTCQVRASRFYRCCSPPASACLCLLHLCVNYELQISVAPTAGPQPLPDLGGHCALLDLNCETKHMPDRL